MFEKTLSKAKEKFGSALSAAASTDTRLAAKKALKGAKEKVSVVAADAAEKIGQSYVYRGRWIPVTEKKPKEGEKVYVYLHQVEIDNKDRIQAVPKMAFAQYITGNKWQTDTVTSGSVYVHAWTTRLPIYNPDEESYNAMLAVDLAGGYPEDIMTHTVKSIDDVHEEVVDDEDIKRDWISIWAIRLNNIESVEDAQYLVDELRKDDADAGSPAYRYLENAFLMACILYVVNICAVKERNWKTVSYVASLGTHDSDSSSQRLERSDLEKLFSGFGRIENGEFTKVYDEETQEALKKAVEMDSLAGIYYRAFKTVAPDEMKRAMLSAQIRLSRLQIL